MAAKDGVIHLEDYKDKNETTIEINEFNAISDPLFIDTDKDQYKEVVIPSNHKAVIHFFKKDSSHTLTKEQFLDIIKNNNSNDNIHSDNAVDETIGFGEYFSFEKHISESEKENLTEEQNQAKKNPRRDNMKTKNNNLLIDLMFSGVAVIFTTIFITLSILEFVNPSIKISDFILTSLGFIAFNLLYIYGYGVYKKIKRGDDYSCC